MSSLWLLRRCGSPLTAGRARTGRLLCGSPRVLSYSLGGSSASCTRLAGNALSSSSSLLLSRPLVWSCSHSSTNGYTLAVLRMPSRRFLSSGRHSWSRKKDWKTTLKTGGLVLVGTGALIASTSLAFGLVMAGAAGFGVYALYQRFFGPYRSLNSRSRNPFSNVSSNSDTLNELFRRSRRRDPSAVQDDLGSLVQGMPFIVRGFVKTVFSLVGQAMQSSMERAGELRRRADEHLQANKRVRDQMGDDVSVGGPEQWVESTINGVGRIEAVFPVNGTYSSARVTVKATIGEGDNLTLTELKYRNRQTGDTIELLHDSSGGGRKKTVIDAEFVDLDENGKSRW